MSTYLEPNVRALTAKDAQLGARIAAAAALSGGLEPTPSGQPTLVVNEVLLHNRLDPAREAEQWAAGQVPRLAEGATAVVLGFGLGYHVEALARRYAGRIVVVEPSLAVLRTACAARDLRPILARVELATHEADEATIRGWGRIVLAAHAPSVLAEGAELRALQTQIAGRAALVGRRLKVLVVSPVAGGSHPIAGYAARALAELGHAVSLLDLAPFAGAMNAIPMFTGHQKTQGRIREELTNFLGAGVLAAVDAGTPDLVLSLAQAPLNPPVLEELRRRDVVSAFWFVEDHRLFAYWKTVAPAYDYFFTIQRGAFLAEAQRLVGRHAMYLPCAADPAVHRPLVVSAEEREEFGAPVSFVGAGYRNRRIAFRPLLDLGLKVWGSDWEGSGQVGAHVQRNGVRISTADAVKIFNTSAVNLNLHSSTYVDGVDPRGDFVNPRTFELAACGAFQLVDERALLPEHFLPGRELAIFGDASEMRERVQHYLARPDERAAIVAAGRARVLAEHTYRHRMEAMLAEIYSREYGRLRAREETVADAAEAEGSTPLGDLLRKLSPVAPFTLDGLVTELQAREGDLSESESILLFLHQFDIQYVREFRS